jgi:hypothetical protein
MSLSLRQSETLPQRCSQRGRPQGQHSIVGDERSSVEKGWGPALGQTSARKMKGDIHRWQTGMTSSAPPVARCLEPSMNCPLL